QGAHQLIEDPANDRPVALQVLDDLHPLEQLLATLAQLLDLLDARVEHGYFLPNESVARDLPLDSILEVLIGQEHEATGHDQNADERHEEALLALFAKLFPPGKKVDPRHQSKLLSASPQAIIREGASLANAPALTLPLRA